MKKYYGLICASVLFVLCSVSPVFSAMEVNINNVVEAFLNNPIRAEQLYMNKEVQTKGRVEEIRRGDNGGFSVVLSGRGNFYFQCWLAGESLNKAANLSKGNRINIRGTIYSFHQHQVGIFIAANIVSLRDCVIIPPSHQIKTFAGTKLNVLSAPDPHKSRIITKLNTGDKVTVLETAKVGQSTWYKIETADGTIGWVFGDYVTRN